MALCSHQRTQDQPAILAAASALKIGATPAGCELPPNWAPRSSRPRSKGKFGRQLNFLMQSNEWGPAFVLRHIKSAIHAWRQECNSCMAARDLVPFPLRPAIKRGTAFDRFADLGEHRARPLLGPGPLKQQRHPALCFLAGISRGEPLVGAARLRQATPGFENAPRADRLRWS